MGRPTPPKPVAPPEDPLADLREPDDAPTDLPAQHDPIGRQAPDCPECPDAEPGMGCAACGKPVEVLAVTDIRPMVTQGIHDEMVAEAVAAFHADPTSQGFLHGGGQCGCRYIARIALQAAVPVVTEADLEERELEPADV